MRRITAVSLTAALSLFALGVAAASPVAKEGGEVCTAGVGKAVCCKTYVADHCGHVSCCEVGNSAFFTQKSCSTCEANADAKAIAARKSGCDLKSGACVEQKVAGTRSFFTGECTLSGKEKATGGGSCSLSGAKAK